MPYKFRERKVKDAPRTSYIPRIVAILLLLAFIGSIPYLWSRYQGWNERRRLERARQALVQGNAKAALLEARGVLERSPKNEYALAIVDRANEAMKAPEAMTWRRVDNAVETADSDQLLGLAEGFLATQDYATAERVLKKVNEGRRTTAKYHDLLGQLAVGRDDLAGARQHWAEAARLDPGDESLRIKSLALLLLVNDPTERAEALAQLEEMAKTDSGSLAARRALIADAQRRQDFSRARELAAELAAAPGAVFLDKLVLLESLYALRPKRNEEFDATLAELEKLAAVSPADVLTLASWMLDRYFAFQVLEWAQELPPETFAQMPAAPVLAQAYVQTADWKQVKQLVEGASWGDQEFMRLAFFSLALERQGNRKASETIWQDATAAAQLTPDRLERLARACELWGWREQAEELLWKLGQSEWCPRWVVDSLWTTAITRGDTPRLREVTKMQLRMDPRNISIRNNLANLTLLLGEPDEATLREAQAVHEEQPESAPIATTYGLSLFLQGRASDAVKMLETYPAEQLRDPIVAVYFGAFLAAAGQTERALEFLDLADGATKLPEEAALVRVFTAMSQARSYEQRGRREEANASWADALRGSERHAAWLDTLARTAIGWGWAAGADAALLKLSAEDRCPPGAEESLWAAAAKTGNGTQMYRASRLLARVKPQDPVIRSRYVLLAVLGQRSKEPPLALAEQLARDFPNSSEPAIALGIALLQQGKTERAAEILTALPPAQRQEPRVALYSGLVRAVAGRTEEAEQLLNVGASSAQYDEERSLVAMIQAALQAAASERVGDAKAADHQWAQAMESAGNRADWTEMLARLAVAGKLPRQANSALWKLAAAESCPLWAAEALWASVVTKGTPMDRYRASKLIAKTDPKNLTARCTWIVLGLLNRQELDAPHREAKAVFATNVTDSGVVVAYALSLYLQKQREEALKTLRALPAESLAEPRNSFYFGVFLGAAGDTESAAKHLRAAAPAKLLPEERAFADQVITEESLKAILRSWSTVGR